MQYRLKADAPPWLLVPLGGSHARLRRGATVESALDLTHFSVHIELAPSGATESVAVGPEAGPRRRRG